MCLRHTFEECPLRKTPRILELKQEKDSDLERTCSAALALSENLHQSQKPTLNVMSLATGGSGRRERAYSPEPCEIQDDPRLNSEREGKILRCPKLGKTRWFHARPNVMVPEDAGSTHLC